MLLHYPVAVRYEKEMIQNSQKPIRNETKYKEDVRV